MNISIKRPFRVSLKKHLLMGHIVYIMVTAVRLLGEFKSGDVLHEFHLNQEWWPDLHNVWDIRDHNGDSSIAIIESLTRALGYLEEHAENNIVLEMDSMEAERRSYFAYELRQMRSYAQQAFAYSPYTVWITHSNEHANVIHPAYGTL